MSIFGVADDRASVRYSPLEQQEGGLESGHLLGEPETAASYVKKIIQIVVNKRKGMGKIIFVIAVIGIILLACVLFVLYYGGNTLLSPEIEQPVQKTTSLRLEDFIYGTFEPTRFNGSWSSDDEILYKNNYGFYVLFNVTSKNTRTLLNDPSLTVRTDNVQISADKQYLIVTVNAQKIYRHSAFFEALIIDTQSQRRYPIADDKGESLVLQLIKWAPKGNGYVYVYYNNIYYKPSPTTTETIQLTLTGNGTLYNGVCDWVYEEEIFSATSAMWFSPNGDKLAFVSFDDSNTDIMSIPYYGGPGSINSQYPKSYNLHYPKPGRANPTFTVSVVNLQDLNPRENSVRIQFPRIFADPILSTATWITNNRLCLVIMNRIQNEAMILSCNSANGSCNELIRKRKNIGWLDMFVPPLFSTHGTQMIFIDSWDQGNELGAYRHISFHDITKNQTTPLTRGRLTVTKILSWDKLQNAVYYTATEENQPMKQQIYKVFIPNDNAQIQPPKCLSCVNDPNCTFASATLSETNSYFVQTCDGPDVPVVSIYDKYNEQIFIWNDNDKIRKKLNDITLPQIQFLTYPVDYKMEAHVLLMLPPRIDKSGNSKYPLIVNVYAGPDSNQVYDKFKVTWETYFSLNHNVIVALIDGRGSGLKGDDVLFSNYRKLGGVEIDDQITVTQKLQQTFSFIDEKRTAIWGWSYGGYATGMALTYDIDNVFKCGVSVAPVTDWIYYDSMYTERFLGLPTENDNKLGYVSASLVDRAKKLAGKKYLLVHGTLDDNVHYQQSMMLARILELNDILFKQQSYPDEVHSLGGVRLHFYHTLEAFFNECFAT